MVSTRTILYKLCGDHCYLFIERVKDKTKDMPLHEHISHLVHKRWCANFQKRKIYMKDYKHYFEYVFGILDHWLDNKLQSLGQFDDSNTHLVEFEKGDLEE